MYVAAADGCGGSGGCSIMIVEVLVLLMVVIMMQSLFMNQSGETLFCELIVLHFLFLGRKVVIETSGIVFA